MLDNASKNVSPRKKKSYFSQDTVDHQEREMDYEKKDMTGTVPASQPRRTKGSQMRCSVLMDHLVILEPITDTPSDLEMMPKKPKGRSVRGHRSTVRY
jgi:hypothetical protein